MCMQFDNNYFPETNTPIGLIFGSRYVRASGAYRETMENGFLLFTRPLKLKQRDFLGIFQLPSEFNMGFYPRTILRPNHGRLLLANTSE